MLLAGRVMLLTALLPAGSTVRALLPQLLTWHDCLPALLHSLTDCRLYITVQWVSFMHGFWVGYQALYKCGPQPVGVADDYTQ